MPDSLGNGGTLPHARARLVLRLKCRPVRYLAFLDRQLAARFREKHLSFGAEFQKVPTVGAVQAHCGRIACEPAARFGVRMNEKEIFQFPTRLRKSGELDPGNAPLRITLEFGLP